MQEAELLAEQAKDQFPQEIRGFLEYARSAARRQDWEEALRRWKMVRDKFSDRPFGYIGCSEALMRLKRYDEAEAELRAACIRFPTNSEPVDELARCAELRGDMAKAVECWKRRIEQFPLELHGYCDAAAAFERMGEHAQADAALRAAIDRFPNEQRPLIARANFLHRQGDLSA